MASLCACKSRTPSPPCLLGVHTIGHAALEGILELISDPLHRQCLLYLSNCSITPLCPLEFHELHLAAVLFLATLPLLTHQCIPVRGERRGEERGCEGRVVDGQPLWEAEQGKEGEESGAAPERGGGGQ
jgi:hypothetical protein